MKKALMTMVLVALLAGCTHQTELPPEGALYRHYAARQDLGVAQLNGFKLSDTVRVDIVMLQAENDEAWRQLTEEFGLRDTTGTTSWLGDTLDPAQRAAWDGQPVVRVIASHERQTIGLYRIENEAQYDALIDYQLNHIKN